MVERQNIFPEGLSKRVVKGQLLYAPVVTVVPGKLVFLSGILARVDFDKGLSPAERAQAWAFEKLCEDNLYWAVVRMRWLDDANFARGPAKFFDSAPAPLRPLIGAMIRRSVRKALHAQGMGRYSEVEMERIAIRDIDAIAAQLGDKPWLMGAEPCSADASVHATIAGLLCPVFETPLRTAAEKHANLVAYSKRGMERWFPS
jgi:glutathione S-transferase